MKKTTVSDKHPPSFFEKRGPHTHNTNLRGSSGIVNASILPQSDTHTSSLTLTPCTCRTAPTLDRCCRGEHPDARHPVSAELGELRTQSPCTVTVFAPPSATTASNHFAEALCPRPTNQDEYTDEKILLCLDGAATIPSAFPTESNLRCTGSFFATFFSETLATGPRTQLGPGVRNSHPAMAASWPEH